VVANRLSLLRRADVVLVLSKGSLVQTGSHDDLVQVPGPYRDAAVLQLMDQEQPPGQSAKDAEALKRSDRFNQPVSSQTGGI
jgi:ATP-binding cassette subfamily B protein